MYMCDTNGIELKFAYKTYGKKLSASMYYNLSRDFLLFKSS